MAEWSGTTFFATSLTWKVVVPIFFARQTFLNTFSSWLFWVSTHRTLQRPKAAFGTVGTDWTLVTSFSWIDWTSRNCFTCANITRGAVITLSWIIFWIKSSSIVEATTFQIEVIRISRTIHSLRTTNRSCWVFRTVWTKGTLNIDVRFTNTVETRWARCWSFRINRTVIARWTVEWFLWTEWTESTSWTNFRNNSCYDWTVISRYAAIAGWYRLFSCKAPY